MNFEETFPLRYYVNLGRREDRRTELEWNLDQVGVSIERFPAVDARFVRNPRGYANKGRYALALTIRMAIRRAKQKRAKALLLLEDDAILHPNFLELVNRIEMPDGWGIFYFGCQHLQRPTPHREGVVRVTRALDAHAWAIHESAYDEIMHSMDAARYPANHYAVASDQYVADLQDRIPTYSCFPNLAWQSCDQSDLTGTVYSLYGKTGAQTIRPQLLEGLMTECLAPEVEGKPVKLGLLFLTRGDVHHPQIWREWVAQSPDDIRIFSHPKNPAELEGGFLEGAQIPEQIETAWGDVSLVRASLALLKAGLEDDTITHFALVSESCVPVQPLTRVLQKLKHDPRCQFGFRDIEKASEVSKLRFQSTQGIPEGCWRFHQQWWLLDRAAAKMVVRNDYTESFKKIVASDEGYFGTVLAMEGYPVDDLVYNENVTWTHWKKLEADEEAKMKKLGRTGKAGSPENHPTLAKNHLATILRSDAIFARKFPPGADVGNYRFHQP